MTIVTRANLRSQFERIRDETKLRANSATRVGGALIDALDSGIGTEYLPVISTTATGAENLTAIQAAVDAARTAGGGRIRLSGPPGNYPLTAPYRDTDSIYPGYVANDEMRRANKAIIIYDADNIELCADPGVVLDRSGDQIADTTYSSYSATLYVSKSKNIYIHDLEFLGYQVDLSLLDDVKTQTSGNHIQVNNGCDGVYIENIIAQDGTSALEVCVARTSGYAQLDPAIGWCRNIFVRNFQSRNNEQGMLWCKADGFEVDGFSEQTWTRSDATTGVCQRALYIHSCKNGQFKSIDLRGAYKTSVLVANYAAVTNVTVDGLTILDMFTPKQFIDSGRTDGPQINLNWEGHGISMQTDNCDGVSFRNVRIDGVCIGVALPGFGMSDVLFDNFKINAAYAGMTHMSNFDTAGWSPVLLNNPIEGLTLRNGQISHFQDSTNYPGIEMSSGLYVSSTAVTVASGIINSKGVNTENLKIVAKNRNARLLNCDGFTANCEFTRSIGASGARNFDFNYSGNRRFSNNLFGNNGKPNSADDAPTASGIIGYSELSAPVKFPTSTFSGLPQPMTATGALMLVATGPTGICLAFSDGATWRLSAPFTGY